MNQHTVTEADLQAYVDGVLPLARQAEIEAYLAIHPAEAERVQAYAQQKDDLHALFDPVLDEPIPPQLAALPRRGWRWTRSLAAGIAIAVVSGSAGWLLHGQLEPDLLARARPAVSTSDRVAVMARNAAVAHVVYSPDARRPVEIGADQEEQLVTWLTKRIGTPVRPPKLAGTGFDLIGGRLLPGESAPVAQFMYQDASGQRLTLYVSTEQAHNRDTGFRFAREGQVNVFYWIDGKFGYALSSAIDKAELTRVAMLVYDQLEPN